MNDNFETIKYLPEKEAPDSIKKRSLMRIRIIKLRPFIYTISVAFLINLLLLGNHIFQYLVRSEAMTVINVFISDFEFSADYIGNAFLGIKEVIPLTESGILMINLIMVIYLATLFKKYKTELLKI
jgi:hypothetical protein